MAGALVGRLLAQNQIGIAANGGERGAQIVGGQGQKEGFEFAETAQIFVASVQFNANQPQLVALLHNFLLELADRGHFLHHEQKSLFRCVGVEGVNAVGEITHTLGRFIVHILENKFGQPPRQHILQRFLGIGKNC